MGFKSTITDANAERWARLYSEGETFASIARREHRSPSTVSRFARNYMFDNGIMEEGKLTDEVKRTMFTLYSAGWSAIAIAHDSLVRCPVVVVERVLEEEYAKSKAGAKERRSAS